jgi:hypothetical protein
MSDKTDLNENCIGLIGKKCSRNDQNDSNKIVSLLEKKIQSPNFENVVNFNMKSENQIFENKYFRNEDNCLELNEQHNNDFINNHKIKTNTYNNDFIFDEEILNSEEFLTFDNLSSGNESNNEHKENPKNKHEITPQELNAVVSYDHRNQQKNHLYNENYRHEDKTKNFNKKNINPDEEEKNKIENKIIKNIKSFFYMKNKTDNNTIKSIDDSTTVSTQFTKGNIGLLNKNSNTKSNCHKSICSNKNLKTHKNNLNIVVESQEKLNNIILDNLVLNKFFRQESSSIDKSAPKIEIINSDGNKNEKNPSLLKPKKVFLESLSQEEKNIIKYQALPSSEDINDKEENNHNYHPFEKNEPKNSFSVNNDFEKTLKDNRGDTKSNEVFKNLLATAKYFNLDG